MINGEPKDIKAKDKSTSTLLEDAYVKILEGPDNYKELWEIPEKLSKEVPSFVLINEAEVLKRLKLPTIKQRFQTAMNNRSWYYHTPVELDYYKELLEDFSYQSIDPNKGTLSPMTTIGSSSMTFIRGKRGVAGSMASPGRTNKNPYGSSTKSQPEEPEVLGVYAFSWLNGFVLTTPFFEKYWIINSINNQHLTNESQAVIDYLYTHFAPFRYLNPHST